MTRQMFPLSMDWRELRFGVEIEFVDADPAAVERLPGWSMGPDDRQVAGTGEESGGELQSPPLSWTDRDQIREMLARLAALNARANWSCGLHVHVGLAPWGQDLVIPLIDAALDCQDGLRALLQTPDHRMIFCPPVTAALLSRYLANPVRPSLTHRGRPQSHRCGINIAAWFDNQTVEIRYANATLKYDQLIRTVELCLRFVAAVGAGRRLPGEAGELAAALGAPANGYPPPQHPPLWHRERMWLEEALLPVVTPQVEALVPGGEVHHIRPTADGLLVAVETEDDRLTHLRLQVTADGIRLALPREGGGRPL